MLYTHLNNDEISRIPCKCCEMPLYLASILKLCRCQVRATSVSGKVFVNKPPRVHFYPIKSTYFSHKFCTVKLSFGRYLYHQFGNCVCNHGIKLISCSYYAAHQMGGIAQWQSIRLQIERSPVQLQLPPEIFFLLKFKMLNIYQKLKFTEWRHHNSNFDELVA